MLRALILCMAVTNHGTMPAVLHGCVPADDWTVSGCEAADDTPNPLRLVVPAGETVTIYDAESLPDIANPEYRLWDDGPLVSVHWQWSANCA